MSVDASGLCRRSAIAQRSERVIESSTQLLSVGRVTRLPVHCAAAARTAPHDFRVETLTRAMQRRGLHEQFGTDAARTVGSSSKRKIRRLNLSFVIRALELRVLGRESHDLRRGALHAALKLDGHWQCSACATWYDRDGNAATNPKACAVERPPQSVRAPARVLTCFAHDPQRKCGE